MFKQLKYTVLAFFLVGLLSSCDSYEKVLKSTDYEFKAAKAKEYYNKGEYYKSQILFEELISYYKGTVNVEFYYYFYAFSYYGQKEYLSSAFYFRRFIDVYPNSKLVEECYFMEAKSYYKLSPRASLDQSYTLKSIDAFQNFTNVYPASSRVTECNDFIDEMRRKLEDKDFQSAELYLNTREYKSAATSLESLIDNYPESPNRERINYLIVKSKYLLAENSIERKKEERYSETITSYYDFVDKFPNSKYSKEAERYFDASANNLKKLTTNE